MDLLNLKLPSSIHKLEYSLFDTHQVSVFAKRDDLIHPRISGNKWRKLKYNIDYFLESKFQIIVSFGGAYSNHLYALGEVCYQLKIPFCAIIRGEGYDENNSTLRTLKEQGHRLVYVSRSDYREKENGDVIGRILHGIDNYYLIPEGGSNALAIYGIIDLCREIKFYSYDHIFVSAGTGATAAGILQYIVSNDISVKLHAVSALKGSFLKAEILRRANLKESHQLWMHDNYHFGGYAKMPQELHDFQKQFSQESGMPMDLVYNAKTMYGLTDLIKNGTITSHDRVLFLNTGGQRE